VVIRARTKESGLIPVDFFWSRVLFDGASIDFLLDFFNLC
jgi:hypothetical protein